MRKTPLSPIFNPMGRRGMPNIGVAIGTPSGPTLMTPVIRWDSRDWTGGTVPTSATGGSIDVGTIPNTGSAGSGYDITVRINMLENGVGGWTDPDYWNFTQARRDSVPSSVWTDLGEPASAPWCVAYALRPFDAAPVNAIGAARTSRVRWNTADEFLRLDGFYNGESPSTLLRAYQEINIDTEWNYFDWQPDSFGAFGDWNDKLMMTSWDPMVSTEAIYINTTDSTSLDTVLSQDTNLSSPASTFNALFAYANLTTVQLGWEDWDREVLPVQGDPWPGISAIGVYRGIPSPSDLLAIMADFGV